MSTVEVRTQSELDAAIAKHGDDPNTLIACFGEEFVISARVRAHIDLRDNATATLWGNATATLRGNATATLRDNATATLRGNATATLRDNATATLWGNATATLRDNATATADGPYTSVRNLSTAAKALLKRGAILIQPPTLETFEEWARFYDVKVSRGVAILYKAVTDEFRSGRGFDYSPGSKPEAPDWKDDDACGGGLHFSPTPGHALGYNWDATRFVACPVRADEVRPITDGYGWSDKVKAPRVVGKGCYEVDINGEPIEVTACA
jgi:hypothetical protein